MVELPPDTLALYRFRDLTGIFLMGIVGGTFARQKIFGILGLLSLIATLGGGMICDA